MQILSALVGLASFVCFVMVLIRLFQEKGALHGILGILSCGIYPFIWGWIHSGRLGIKNLMLAWTGLIILGIVLNIVFGVAVGPSLPAV